MSKETFKNFVRSHPELANHVMKKNASWQQFYELYDLYGENNSVWNDYIKTTSPTTETVASSKNTRENAMGELIKMVKNVDLNSVQKTVGNLQKTIGLLQDLGIGAGSAAIAEKPYEPRPMYRYFED